MEGYEIVSTEEFNDILDCAENLTEERKQFCKAQWARREYVYIEELDITFVGVE